MKENQKAQLNYLFRTQDTQIKVHLDKGLIGVFLA